jgi:hypothetical protein
MTEPTTNTNIIVTRENGYRTFRPVDIERTADTLRSLRSKGIEILDVLRKW